MKTKPPSETTAKRISQARLLRLTRQNEKLEIEEQRLKGEVGPIEDFMPMVLRANSLVKGQILSVPIRVGPGLGLTREQIESIKQELVGCCNDLAFERERPVGTCPTCGGKLKEEP
jgi:hypothetical protein